MYQLEKQEINQVTGAHFFGPLFHSLTSGMTESEMAIGITAMGTGLVTGCFLGKWGLAIGVLGTVSYVGWDWYASSGNTELLTS